MELQPYDFLLVSGDSWVSSTIKKISKSKYSHIAIVAKDTNYIFETKINKPFALYPNEYKEFEYDVYRYKHGFTPNEKYIMEHFLKEKLNYKYDVVKTVTNGLFILFKFPIIDVSNRLNCVESAKWLYRACGINLKGNTPEEVRMNDCLHKVEG